MKNFYSLILFGAIVFSSGMVTAQTVTSAADDGSPGTLRQEIMDAAAGDEITFADGISLIVLNSAISIDKSLTISGSGDGVTLDANSNDRIFTVSAGTVVLNNLNLINGLADDGGAIYISDADLTINDSEFFQNVANGAAGSGGAIFNAEGASLTVNNSSFMENRANRAGGAIEDNSGAGLAITLNNVVMTGNNAGVAPATAAPGNGGAVHITGAGDIEINGGSASGNIAAKEGGALWNGSGTMTINGADISGNSAIGDLTGGGGLFNNGGTLVVDAATSLTANIAMGATPGGRGGAIFNNTGGMLDLEEGLTISGNYASRAGGAIEDASGNTLTLVGINFTGNSAGVDIGLGNEIIPNPGNGGAIHLSGTDADISGGMANDNMAAAEGGAYWNNVGMMTVDGTSFDGNIAGGPAADQGGGALYNDGGTMVVMNITADNNVADGAAGSGGAILNALGALTVSGSSFSGNSAQRAGGAIEDASTEGGVLTLTDNDFTENTVAMSPGNGGAVHVGGPGDSNISGGSANGNTAGAEGGAFWNNVGTMTVDGTTFDGNTASGAEADQGGGALFNNGGTMVVMNITADNNVADGAAGSGGGILNDGGSLTVYDSEFSGNTATRAGGAIEEASEEGTMLMVTNVDFTNNSTGDAPGNGGAIHVTGVGDASISGGIASGNTAASEGGAFWNSLGTMTVDGVTIDGNTASGAAADNGGGGLFNNGGTLNVTESTISGNMANGAAGSGGGLLSTAGNVSVMNSSFAENAANRAGGAIEIIDGNLDFSNSSMTNNDVNGTAGTPAPGNGGGLHVTGMSGSILIAQSTVSGNEAGREGGGLWNQSGTMMNVTNSTISGNSTFGISATQGGAGIFNNGGILTVMLSTLSGNTAAGSGGGILNGDGGLTTITATTIAYNDAAIDGGGIFSMGVTSLNSTLLAFNSAASGQDLAGAVSSNEYNLVSEDDLNSFAEAATDIEGIDPALAPLQDNGGMTATHALLPGSAGIDAGDPDFMMGDQRNYTLVGVRDIGAFEFGGIQNGGIDCDNYVYFLADHQFPEDISDLYRVTVSDGVADLEYLATVDVEVHIAYNPVNNLVYAIAKDDGSIYILDPNADTPEYSDPIAIDAGLTKITQAVCSPDGKMLVSSSDQDVIYSINLMNGYAVSVYDSYAPIEGGDLAYSADGSTLVMSTRESGGGFYSIFPNEVLPDQLLGMVPTVVTGMSTMQSGDFLISSKGATEMLVMTMAGENVGSFPVMLNGEPFTLRDGDMTSGCAESIPGDDNPTPATGEAQSFMSSYPNPVSGTSQIQFTTATTTFAQVEVFDVSGKKVTTLYSEVATAGVENRLNFDTSSLPNGVYVYRLITVNETVISKFIIAR